jgi:ATP-dependent Clp protease ATP-binding subunit ClpC
MTSNVGAELIQKETAIGFVARTDAQSSYERMKGTVLEELKKKFRPEFLNRIDEAIVFRPLSKEELEIIVGIMISDVNRRLEEKGLSISVTRKAEKFIVDQGYDPKMGARPLRRAVEDQIEDPLSEEILKGKFPYGSAIKADVKKEHLVFTGKRKRIEEKPPEIKPGKKLQEASK